MYSLRVSPPRKNSGCAPSLESTCAVTVNAINTFEFVIGFGVTAYGDLVHF
jgi:hypothetical protein